MNANAIKTIQFADYTHTGHRWAATASHVTRFDLRDVQSTKDAAALAKRARRAGWSVEVLTDGPGASEILGR